MPARVSVTTRIVPGEVPLDVLRRRVTERPDYVRVGLPDVPHQDSAITLAQLGAIHEYGAPRRNIPERPFLHPSLRAAQPQLAKLAGELLFQVQNGKLVKRAALERLGFAGVGIVQRYIRDSSHFTELKPATVARKGSSKPLIDTGQMIQNVTFQVER